MSNKTVGMSYKVYIHDSEAEALSNAWYLANAHHEDNQDEAAAPLVKSKDGKYRVLNRGEMLVIDLEKRDASDSLVAEGSFAF